MSPFPAVQNPLALPEGEKRTFLIELLSRLGEEITQDNI